MGDLDAQNLEILVEADGDPVRLSGPPLDLVYLALGGRVREDGVLDGPRHLLDVPNQGLVVVTCRKNVLWQQSQHMGHHIHSRQSCQAVSQCLTKPFLLFFDKSSSSLEITKLEALCGCCKLVTDGRLLHNRMPPTIPKTRFSVSSLSPTHVIPT